MKPIWMLRLALFGMLLMSVCIGCQSQRAVDFGPSKADSLAAIKAQKRPLDALEAWLVSAPFPAQMRSTVERGAAPELEARFNQLAMRSAQLYTFVHNDALAAVEAINAGDFSKDKVLSSVPFGKDNATWKTDAQAVVIEHYQQVMKEVDALRKEVTDFPEMLKHDAAIATLSDAAVRTNRLVCFGNDTMRVLTQLKEASEGATLTRMRRIAAVLGK